MGPWVVSTSWLLQIASVNIGVYVSFQLGQPHFAFSTAGPLYVLFPGQQPLGRFNHYQAVKELEAKQAKGTILY